jgi:hypothetical protein
MEYTCTTCNLTKDSSEFRSKNKCNACRKEYFKNYSKAHYQANKDDYRERNKLWVKNNHEKQKAYGRKSYHKNKEVCNDRSRAYSKLNRETLSRKEKERIDKDIAFKIKKRLRTRLYVSVKSQGTIKHKSTLKLLGCTIIELKAHLESKFLPTMTWDNYGSLWHIDHIIPCSKFDLTNEEEQRRCFHYTNLQPLFALTTIIDGVEYIGNMSKHDKMLLVSEDGKQYLID